VCYFLGQRVAHKEGEDQQCMTTEHSIGGSVNAVAAELLNAMLLLQVLMFSRQR